MTIWVIKDRDGNVTNPGINASEEFVQANFDYYEAPAEIVAPSIEVSSRLWRDAELIATDIAAQTPDWPNRDNIIIYRAALRDWPSTSDFPDRSRVLGT